MSTIKKCLSVLKKVVLGFSLAAALSSCGNEDCLKEYLKKAKTRIVSQLEQNLSIYFSHPPRIEIDETIRLQVMEAAGAYFPLENTVYLNHAYLNNTLLDSDIACDEENPPTDFRVEQIIRHELGHFYVDQRSEELGLGDFPDSDYYSATDEEAKKDRNFGCIIFPPQTERELLLPTLPRTPMTLSEAFLLKVISEGIGEYFGSFGEKADTFANHEWPRDVQDVTDKNQIHLVYDGGYHLQKPLMDEFGVEMTTDYEVAHPPEVSKNFRRDLLRYQKQVQDALRGEE